MSAAVPLSLGELHGSRFTSATSNRPAPMTWADWAAFGRWLRATSEATPHPDPRGELDADTWAATKKTLPAWSPARYAPGKTRSKAHVLGVSMLVADLDDVRDQDVAALRARLVGEGLAFVLHSTPSQARCAPGLVRARLVVPFEREAPGDMNTWATTRAACLAHLGLTEAADPSASDASRIYFVPVQGAALDMVEGRPLDAHELVYLARERDAIVSDTTPAQAPPALRPRVLDADRAALDELELSVARASNGQRNVTLNRSAFTVAGLVAAGRVSENEGRAALERAARACGLPEAEARATIASGWTAGGARPLEREARRPAPVPAQAAPRAQRHEPRPFTDLGNAEALIDQHGDDLRHVNGLGWLVWDGRRWERDETGEAMRRAKATVRQRYIEAAAVDSDEQRKSAITWARKSESSGHLASMLSLASTEAKVVARTSELDADPMLLNAQNGTIDLRTGRMRDHRRADLITKVAGAPFDPEATCPTFDRFLHAVFAGDAELIAFVQRFIGYALTGDVREQVLMFCYGTGANGKSTFIDLAIDLLGGFGGYARPAAPGLLVAKKGDQHPTELADLRGARLVSCVEVGDGKRFDEERVKALTGGDPIKARLMREDFFTFAPTHKLIVAANHRPTVRGTDHAIWRRILLVPFTVTFSDAQKDRDLPAKLRAELPGILRWAVEGCLAWQREGLRPPASVRAATDAYRVEQDQVGRFLGERCVLAPHASGTAAALYGAYRDWAREAGEHELPARRFGESLAERGLESTRGTGGTRCWRGVGLDAGRADQ